MPARSPEAGSPEARSPEAAVAMPSLVARQQQRQAWPASAPVAALLSSSCRGAVLIWNILIYLYKFGLIYLDVNVKRMACSMAYVSLCHQCQLGVNREPWAVGCTKLRSCIAFVQMAVYVNQKAGTALCRGCSSLDRPRRDTASRAGARRRAVIRARGPATRRRRTAT